MNLRRSSWYLHTAIVIGAVVTSFAIAEVVLSFAWPQELSTSFRIVDPEGLHLNRAHGHARHQHRNNRTVGYRFNAFHQRGGPVDYSRPRVLVLGDSFTFGWLLEEPNTFVSLLQSRAEECASGKSYQFLNGGAGGWGTASYLRYLERFGERLAPDIVLVFLNTDDIDRAIRSGFYVLTKNNDLQFRPRPAHVSRLKRFVNSIPGYDFLLEHSHSIQLMRRAHLTASRYLRNVSRTVPSADSHEPARHVELAPALFRRLNAWCQEHGCRLLVTTTGFFTPDSASAATGNFVRTAPAFFRQLGVPFFDAAPDIQDAFAQEERNAYAIAGDGHPNERGARLIARTVWPWLRSEILPDC